MNPAPSLGILEIHQNGSGFLRRREAAYLPNPADLSVGQGLVRQYELRTGDEIWGEAGQRQKGQKHEPLGRITAVNGRPPEEMRGRPEFNRLSAQHPKEQLTLECELIRRGKPDITLRVIDLFCPFGKGQRAMIVAQSKAGKTMVLQAVAQGIVTNYPKATLYILLVDERPEEVTEMEMCGFGEVISSSFDHPAERHIDVAEMTAERARRKVEMGEDVVIILDSITRLARAYNTVESGNGRTLSGGLGANSLEKPKKFLGSARKIDPNQGGGSLTIIATALVDTGSKMDQVIFEEFKGTGNSELVLSRELADRRVYPAIDITASATRKEELLLSPEALASQQALRRNFANGSPLDAMQQLITLMGNTKTNEEFIKKAGR
ncbi:MAG TPA: transcription termination factor Rho [Gemmatimonadales bacterium]